MDTDSRVLLSVFKMDAKDDCRRSTIKDECATAISSFLKLIYRDKSQVHGVEFQP